MAQKYQSAMRVRFPTYPLILMFVGSDTVNEFKSEDGAIHVIERCCKLDVDAQRLLKNIAGFDYVYFVQKNSLNSWKRTLHIEALNETFSNRYTIHPENEDWTYIKSFFDFERKEIIEHYLRHLEEERITFVPCWTPPSIMPSSETSSSSCKKQTASMAVVIPDAALKKGLSGDAVSSPSAPEPVVDADYIKRYLGNLTLLQESSLIRLHLWLQKTHKGKIPKDEHILQFLRARDFNIDKAREIICQSLTWRKQHQVDYILDYYTGGWHHYNKGGRPLCVLRLGQMDTNGLVRVFGEEALLRYILSINEEGLRQCEENIKVFIWHISSWTCLVDLEGLNMRHLWIPDVKALWRIIEVVKANYHERLSRLLILRAPRVFPVLWTLVSPFIDDNTRKKFLIYAGNDYQGPGDFLSGECMCKAPEGGLVPRSLYWTVEELENEDFNIFKGAPHKILIQIVDASSVITWNFDVYKGDIVFNIYHSKRLPQPPKKDSLGLIDTVWQRGHNCSMVELPLICKEREGVQGSHVTSWPGLYILHMPTYTASSLPQVDDVLASLQISSHNCKVMYYTKVIGSEGFRGSMTSLESSHSGFSQLSTPPPPPAIQSKVRVHRFL
uniref:CRAL-TRIO domain-containing protein n=1 Tax=Rhinopithecus roxellana TaxID=61622 RepID=A0A2K6R6V5_RHIRO